MVSAQPLIGPAPCSCVLPLHQVELLRAAKGDKFKHCVQLKAEVFFPNGAWRRSVILHPCCSLLGSNPGLKKLSRLGYDVAQAIEELFQVGLVIIDCK